MIILFFIFFFILVTVQCYRINFIEKPAAAKLAKETATYPAPRPIDYNDADNYLNPDLE